MKNVLSFLITIIWLETIRSAILYNEVFVSHIHYYHRRADEYPKKNERPDWINVNWLTLKPKQEINNKQTFSFSECINR